MNYRFDDDSDWEELTREDWISIWLALFKFFGKAAVLFAGLFLFFYLAKLLI